MCENSLISTTLTICDMYFPSDKSYSIRYQMCILLFPGLLKLSSVMFSDMVYSFICLFSIRTFYLVKYVFMVLPIANQFILDFPLK